MAESELDNLDRLAKTWRGTLTGPATTRSAVTSGPPSTGVTSRTFKQNWTLEGLGHWKRRNSWMSPFLVHVARMFDAIGGHPWNLK